MASNAVIELPLAAAVRAHEMLETRPRPAGKIVLRVRDDASA